LTQEKLLAQIDYRNVPNFKNISLNFRDLIYDPGNKHAIPYNWGTTGLIVRSDLVTEPVTSWNDLWNPRYTGKVGLWQAQSREVIGIALKSLGYSINSEKPAELEQALARLLALKPGVVFYDDYDPVSAAPVFSSGKAVIGMGYALDVLETRKEKSTTAYILPQEGALLWGDNFIIPVKSANKLTAETLINFLLRPEVNAQIANENSYATPNEAALPFIQPEILNDPVIFPPQSKIQNAEIILPLSPAGQKLYDDLWQKFLAEK
jgi:spermidine/putrescine transport system substrate-binding protein